MEQKEFNYQKQIKDTIYTIIVRESETAKETVLKKLERALIKDSLEGCRSKGVNL